MTDNQFCEQVSPAWLSLISCISCYVTAQPIHNWVSPLGWVPPPPAMYIGSQCKSSVCASAVIFRGALRRTTYPCRNVCFSPAWDHIRTWHACGLGCSCQRLSEMRPESKPSPSCVSVCPTTAHMLNSLRRGKEEEHLDWCLCFTSLSLLPSLVQPYIGTITQHTILLQVALRMSRRPVALSVKALGSFVVIKSKEKICWALKWDRGKQTGNQIIDLRSRGTVQKQIMMKTSLT